MSGARMRRGVAIAATAVMMVVVGGLWSRSQGWADVVWVQRQGAAARSVAVGSNEGALFVMWYGPPLLPMGMGGGSADGWHATSIDTAGTSARMPVLGRQQFGGNWYSRLGLVRLQSCAPWAEQSGGVTATLPAIVIGRGVYVPYWAMELVLAGVLTRCGWREVRHWRAARAARGPVCERCGYDLRATPERCPECGDKVAGERGDTRQSASGCRVR